MQETKQSVIIRKSTLFVIILVSIALASYLMSYVIASEAFELARKGRFVTAFRVTIPTVAMLFGSYYFYEAKIRKKCLKFTGHGLHDLASHKRLGEIEYSQIRSITVYSFAGMSTFVIKLKNSKEIWIKGMRVPEAQRWALSEKFGNIQFIR